MKAVPLLVGHEMGVAVALAVVAVVLLAGKTLRAPNTSVCGRAVPVTFFR